MAEFSDMDYTPMLSHLDAAAVCSAGTRTVNASHYPSKSVHSACPHGDQCCVRSWPIHRTLGTAADHRGRLSTGSDDSDYDDGGGDRGCDRRLLNRNPHRQLPKVAVEDADKAKDRSSATRKTVRFDVNVRVLCDEHDNCEYYARACYRSRSRSRLRSPPLPSLPYSPSTLLLSRATVGRIKRTQASRKARARFGLGVSWPSSKDDGNGQGSSDGSCFTRRSCDPCNVSEVASSASAAVQQLRVTSSAPDDGQAVGKLAKTLTDVELEDGEQHDESSGGSAPGPGASRGRKYKRGYEWLTKSLREGPDASRGRKYKRGYEWLTKSLRDNVSSFSTNRPLETGVEQAQGGSKDNSSNHQQPRRTPLPDPTCCRCSSCNCCNCCRCRKGEWTTFPGSDNDGGVRRHGRDYEWLRGHSEESEMKCRCSNT